MSFPDKLSGLLSAAKNHLKNGLPQEAIPLLQHACAIAPDSDDAQCSLGVAYLDSGDHAKALVHMQRAHALRTTSHTHFNLGLIALRTHRFADAVRHFSGAVEMNGTDSRAWQHLGQAYFLNSQPVHALLVFLKMVREDPSSAAFRHLLAGALKNFAPQKFESVFVEALQYCLEEPTLSHDDLTVAFNRVIALDPSQNIIRSGIGARSYDAYKEQVSAIPLEELKNPLLLQALGAFIMRDVSMEQSLIFLRRYLLETYAESPEKLKPYPQILAALARQAYLAEYVYEEEEPESAAIDALEAAIANMHEWTTESVCTYLLLACYRPVVDIPACASLNSDESIMAASSFAACPQLAAVLEEQVCEVRRERAIKSTIPTLGTPSDATSQLVRAMYEQNPYPRWKSASILGTALNGALDISSLRARAGGRPLEILIAGCGTGKHVIQSHTNFPDANITAIDLSFSSLAYAKMRCEERNLRNVTFMQADILELAKLGKQFDSIESVGVLHHMKDPMAGWRVLTELLKPGGYMRIGLYSEAARQDVVQCRDFIAQQGYEPTSAGIRACRKTIKNLPHGHPLRQVLNSHDFYSMSLCRDLIFHVQEHRFSIPQIRDCLAELGLNFVAFDITVIAMMLDYAAKFPHDSLFSSLENWNAYEHRNPMAFRGMYQFWCQKPEG